MATYNFTPAGGGMGSGCAELDTTFTLHSAYSSGDIVFFFSKAAKGVLEATTIKSIDIDNTGYVGYTDVLNAKFCEADVIDHETAIELAQDYLNAQIALLNGRLSDLC